MSLIEKSSYFDAGTFVEHPVGSGTMFGWYYPNKPNQGGGVFIRDNIVQVLDLDATSGMTMGEVVKHFGEPKKIQTNSGLFGEHQSGFNVRAYYPQSGIVFHFAMKPLSRNNRASVRPDLVVDEITLFPLDTSENIASVANQFQGPTTLANIYRLPLQDWHGYGDYEILPPLTK